MKAKSEVGSQCRAKIPSITYPSIFHAPLIQAKHHIDGSRILMQINYRLIIVNEHKILINQRSYTKSCAVTKKRLPTYRLGGKKLCIFILLLVGYNKYLACDVFLLHRTIIPN